MKTTTINRNDDKSKNNNQPPLQIEKTRATWTQTPPLNLLYASPPEAACRQLNRPYRQNKLAMTTTHNRKQLHQQISRQPSHRTAYGHSTGPTGRKELSTDASTPPLNLLHASPPESACSPLYLPYRQNKLAMTTTHNKKQCHQASPPTEQPIANSTGPTGRRNSQPTSKQQKKPSRFLFISQSTALLLFNTNVRREYGCLITSGRGQHTALASQTPPV